MPESRHIERFAGTVALAEGGVATVGLVTLFLFFGVALANGASQPWGTINDVSGLVFFALLACLLLLVQRISWHTLWRGSPGVTAVGTVAASFGLVGSGFLVWEELGAPTNGAGGLFAGVGLGLQTVAAITLIAWCVLFGYQLKVQGWPAALRWGIVGATYVGSPAWFVWLGRRLLRGA